MAYSDGDVREAVEAEGAELVAKVPLVTNGGRFPKTDFIVRRKTLPQALLAAAVANFKHLVVLNAFETAAA